MADDLASALASIKEEEALSLAKEMLDSGQDPVRILELCREGMDIVGKGGGFIMDGAIGIPDEAKIENVRAMVDFTREYGVYK